MSISCYQENLQVACSQILYSRLRSDTKLKYKVYSTFIVVQKDNKTLKNSRIKTRSSIASARRDLLFIKYFSIEILYRFKIAIDFFSISTINNAILRRIS